MAEEEMTQEQMLELQKKNCVFCKIIAGEVPSHKVYEDDKIIAILDIYPSVKGHILVMPKEHAPILPIVPKDVLKYLFRKMKYLCKGVKEGLPSVRSTIFIANGGIAGQQSPHFLFHIVPRDDGDGLDNFNIPENDVNQDELLAPLKANLEKMMGALRPKQAPASAGQSPLAPPQTQGAPASVGGPSPDQKKKLAALLEEHDWLKKKIMENPEEVKSELERNPEVKKLFENIDINALSEKLKQLEAQNNASSAPVQKNAQPASAPVQSPVDEKPAPTQSVSQQESENNQSVLEKEQISEEQQENVEERNDLPDEDQLDSGSGDLERELSEDLKEEVDEDLDKVEDSVQDRDAESDSDKEKEESEDDQGGVSQEGDEDEDKKDLLDKVGDMFK